MIGSERHTSRAAVSEAEKNGVKKQRLTVCDNYGGNSPLIDRREAMANALLRCAMLLAFLCVPLGALAHDASHEHADWFNKQEMNPAARERMGVPWKSCCDNGDVFKTRFRVADDHSDQWQYLKDGEWRVIPPDIIKEGDTPDHTPVLFINKNTGMELCFFLPHGGI